MEISIKTWRKNDWISFFLISLFLTLQLLFVGYPIIAADSGRYLGAAIFLKDSSFSPTLTCYLISPLVMLMGVWGFPMFQIAILTYTLVSALKFFNKNATIGIISILISAAGFLALQVMMDIYTAIGLLALFLVLNGSKDIILHIILSLCFVAHYGNVFLFPICAALYWVIFNRKNPASLTLPIILFIIPLIAAFLVNYWLNKDPRFLTKVKYGIIAARIMIDSPEIVRGYSKEYPESGLAKHMTQYENIILHKRRIGSLIFHEELFPQAIIRKEAKQFIVYALKNHSGTLLRSKSYGIYRFFIKPDYKSALILYRGTLVNKIEIFLPREIERIKKSLQYRNKLKVVNFEFFYIVCYYMSLLVISTFFILSFWFPNMRKTQYFSFVVFVIFLLFFNALIFSIGPLHGRFQVRVLLLPCLAACLIISDVLNKLFFNYARRAKI